MTNTDKTIAGTDVTAELPMRMSYRCVCGKSFQVALSATGAACPHCHRAYEAEAFRAGGDTLTIGHNDEAHALRKTAEAKDDDPLIGQTLDHYRIVSCLGRGGMGAVYKAVDQSLQRDVAVKVIHTGEGSSGHQRHVERLLQEARAQARVNHPNVVHIHYVGLSEENPFFAMELVGGQTLAERLEDGPLPFAQALQVAMQVVGALDRAAAFDIVHGDVKPSNVLETADGPVKLSDFGLARRISRRDDNEAHVTGTPDYMSPEACRGEQLDQQSDIYSLGVTLFQLTFGRLPYMSDSSSIMEKIDAHQRQPIEFPDPWPANVPQQWRNVLQRMMAKDRSQRYANYEDLQRDLAQLQPTRMAKARWLPRGLAWSVDQMLVFAVQAFFLNVSFWLANESLNYLQWEFPRTLILASLGVTSAVFPFAAFLLQGLWRTTPGKKLFHLQVVDDHGLTPSQQVMAIRSVFQFLLLWLYSASSVLLVLQMYFVDLGLHIGVLLFLTIDIGFALFDAKGRSVHDLLLGTQTVLEVER